MRSVFASQSGSGNSTIVFFRLPRRGFPLSGGFAGLAALCAGWVFSVSGRMLVGGALYGCAPTAKRVRHMLFEMGTRCFRISRITSGGMPHSLAAAFRLMEFPRSGGNVLCSSSPFRYRRSRLASSAFVMGSMRAAKYASTMAGVVCDRVDATCLFIIPRHPQSADPGRNQYLRLDRPIFRFEP